jgi:hypothetical protein
MGPPFDLVAPHVVASSRAAANRASPQALDDIRPVGLVGGQEGPRRPGEGRLCGDHPGSEVRHPRLAVEACRRQVREGGAYRIEERSQDAGAGRSEVLPKLGFCPPVRLSENREVEDDGAVDEILPGQEVLDTVEDDGAHGGEDRLFGQGVKLAGREPAARGETARASENQSGTSERLSKPRSQELMAAIRRSLSSRGIDRREATEGSTSSRTV